MTNRPIQLSPLLMPLISVGIRDRAEPMIERLQQVLTWLEQLLPEVQEEAAAQLEALAEPFEEIPIKKLLLQSSPVKRV